ncbi:hypothetical protein BDY24DRAFT_82570 [Mrakia frigida]|uniref:uncharacterized protein n=1 Tax=Mrakia frigida TaxID=29902 RepID=UPI003FCC1785
MSSGSTSNKLLSRPFASLFPTCSLATPNIPFTHSLPSLKNPLHLPRPPDGFLLLCQPLKLSVPLPIQPFLLHQPFHLPHEFQTPPLDLLPRRLQEPSPLADIHDFAVSTENERSREDLVLSWFVRSVGRFAFGRRVFGLRVRGRGGERREVGGDGWRGVVRRVGEVSVGGESGEEGEEGENMSLRRRTEEGRKGGGEVMGWREEKRRKFEGKRLSNERDKNNKPWNRKNNKRRVRRVEKVGRKGFIKK